MAMSKQKEKDIEIIKGYKMVEGDYSVQIRILEANDLIPTFSGFSIFKSKGSVVNAFVECKVNDQVKQTKIVKGQLSPIFNQILTFKFKDMKKAQLQNSTITITALHKQNAVFSPTVIGSYELDLSSVYFNLNHELYRTYLTLSDPTDEREGCMGFILCNICVLGPNDEPVIHDVTTEKKADATKGQTLIPKKIKQWPHLIRINLLKGEHMVPLDGINAEIDAYVVIKYGGVRVKSKVVTSRNPEWCQQLNIACVLPNQSKYIDIALYDRDLLKRDDELAGQFQVPFKDISDIESSPIWLNLYGSPLKGKDKEADLMNLYGSAMGSHYRGRLLVTMQRFNMHDSKSFTQELQFKFPNRPMPISEQKSYILRVDLLEGFELPNRKQVIIQVKMGPYLLVSEPGIQADGTCTFYQNLPDKKVLFPKITLSDPNDKNKEHKPEYEMQQIPDIIIYMADDNIEDRRHCFLRVKALDVLEQPAKAKVYKLEEDRSLKLIEENEFPGFLCANIQLMSYNPGTRIPFKPDIQTKVEYELRVLLYIGRDIPPGDANGSCDPYVTIRCAGQKTTSKTCRQTLNPSWYQTLKLDVKLYPLDQTQLVPSGMFITVFDQDTQSDQEVTADLIGRCWITLEPQVVKFQSQSDKPAIDVLYRKPKWYNIYYDPTDQAQGKILLSYILIKKEDAHLVPDEELYPESKEETLNLFCIGLRNVEQCVDNDELSKLAISFAFSGKDINKEDSDYKTVHNNGININRLISMKLDVPRNQNFSPVTDLFVWNKVIAKEGPPIDSLVGVTTIELSTILQNYYKKLHLQPDAIIEEDTDDDEEVELMKILDNKKKLKTQKEHDINANVELELDKIDLQVPWELPVKKLQVPQDEYYKLQESRKIEKLKIKQIGEELLARSKVSSHEFDLNSIEQIQFDDKPPQYNPTTYNQNPYGDIANDNPVPQNDLDLIRNLRLSQSKISFEMDEEHHRNPVEKQGISSNQVNYSQEMRSVKLSSISHQNQQQKQGSHKSIEQVEKQASKRESKQNSFRAANDEDFQQVVDEIEAQNVHNQQIHSQHSKQSIKYQQSNQPIQNNIGSQKSLHYQEDKQSSQRSLRNQLNSMNRLEEQNLLYRQQDQNENQFNNIQQHHQPAPLSALVSDQDHFESAQPYYNDVQVNASPPGSHNEVAQDEYQDADLPPNDDEIQIPEEPIDQNQPIVPQKTDLIHFPISLSELPKQPQPSHEEQDQSNLCSKRMRSEIYFQEEEMPIKEVQRSKNSSLSIKEKFPLKIQQEQGQKQITLYQFESIGQLPQGSLPGQNQTLFQFESARSFTPNQPAIKKQQFQYENLIQGNGSPKNQSLMESVIQEVPQEQEIEKPPRMSIVRGQVTIVKNMTSQRSIRVLSQQDESIIVSPEKHYKNAQEVQRARSHRSSRISVQTKGSIKSELEKLPDQDIYKNFKVNSRMSFDQASKLSSKALSMNSKMQDNTGEKEKNQRVRRKKQKIKDIKRNKFFAMAAAFLPKKKKEIDQETYEDFDTDPGEDLNMTPVWLEGRKFLKDDLEDFMKPSKKFMKFSIMTGRKRGKTNKFLQEKQDPYQQICEFKCIFLEEKKGDDIETKKQMYMKMMRPKKFHCRLYFLQGVDIQSEGDEPPDLYMKIITPNDEYNKTIEKEVAAQSLRKATNNPQFFFAHEFPIDIPGPASVELQIYSKENIKDTLIGQTIVDLEDRYFTILWHKFDMKPIENRNLKDINGSSVGRLQLWIDLVEEIHVKSNPLVKISAPPRYEFELRSIVYQTRETVFKDELGNYDQIVEKCNDLYAKGGIANQELQETDTHWRCRAKGSFNWRMKNKVWYPPLPDDFGTDKFRIQLWDKDIIGSDELIGENSFSLETHKLIDKAVKRLTPVMIKQRIREKGGIITDKFWIHVYHPDVVDDEGQKISQGQVQMSFELMPLTEAEKKENGRGRDPPNVFPPLAEPTGRLSFDITNPLAFIKDIVGPELYAKIWKAVFIALCLGFGCTFGWMFLGPLIASAITK